ncbi:MAG: HD domain-containing protein [Acidobacteria bacterium]|jgi:guanosine-3',5'-bis(diphosphate) 3'-pyrophosphohydrolase|nr:HD domain-containing protein [Acidobacteriota bacterium]
MNDLPKLLEAINFAAKKHSTQKRKGADEQPYINHPLEVLNLLINVGKIEDYNVLIAAVLHDTIEDTETTKEEITELFGADVGEMVLEVTDDKSLPKAERKQKQIEHAPHLSRGARYIKLGDKISNIRDVSENPPDGWSDERRLEYVEWGEKVIGGLRGVNENLENYFDELVAAAREAIEKPQIQNINQPDQPN